MAGMSVIDVHFTVEGGQAVCDMIAHLKQENDVLVQSLTHVQTVSTQQVERIRALEAELARIRGMA